MATPGSYHNPVRETEDLQDKEVVEAYQQGHDAPEPQKHLSPHVDVEKVIPSQATSTHSDDPTLTGPSTEEDAVQDPDIVDWDGPDDPENPFNWSKGKKWGLIASIAGVTFVTPLASSFFTPGVPQVLETFDISSNIIAGLVVSIYLLGFAIGPLIIAPLSEVYGRFVVYNVCNLLFIIFTICCAVSNSIGMLIAFRVLAGCAGSCPITIGAGTIADIFPLEQRAGAMALYSMGPLCGPVLGPIAGGFLVQAKGWRWVFWVLAMMGGAFAALLLVVGNETYAPTILARKTARLRKQTGNLNLRSKLDKGIPAKEVFIRSIIRPMKMLLFSPIVSLMAIYIAINYGILYLFFTTITFVFEGHYHFSTSIVGLAYIGLGVGMFMGMGYLGTMSDKIILKHKEKGDVTPEHRLDLLLSIPGAILMPIGIFIYGWTTDKHVHWIVPIAATSLIGLGNLTSMMTIQTYLVDAFTIHAASAIAANTVLRSIFGAFLPLGGLDMYNALGLGWGNSLLGFISLSLIPVPILFRFYGNRIRTKYHIQF